MEGGTMAAGDAQNRRLRARHPTDRLSELPDSSLLHILSFLHMRDAVSAAGISRRWRHLWTATPCLDFCSYGAELSPNFIDTALMLHDRVKGPSAPPSAPAHTKMCQMTVISSS